MRHRVRIQPYIPNDLHLKLRAHSMAHTLTDSAVTEAALREYLERDAVDEDLVVRRAPDLHHAVRGRGKAAGLHALLQGALRVAAAEGRRPSICNSIISVKQTWPMRSRQRLWPRT